LLVGEETCFMVIDWPSKMALDLHAFMENSKLRLFIT
jgi:hypothetical protein